MVADFVSGFALERNTKHKRIGAFEPKYLLQSQSEGGVIGDRAGLSEGHITHKGRMMLAEGLIMAGAVQQTYQMLRRERWHGRLGTLRDRRSLDEVHGEHRAFALCEEEHIRTVIE